MPEKTLEKKQVTLKDYLLIIFSRRKFFFIPFMIIFFTASMGSFLLPKYYRSGVLVKVEERRPINPLAPEQRFPLQTREITVAERLKTLTEEILSYPHLITLIREENLAEDAIGDLAAFESLIKNLRKRINIRMRSPEVFAVYYEDKNPQKAKDAVNSLMKIFIEEDTRRKKEQAMVGADYAERQAQIYKEKLNKTEQRLRDFREKHTLQLPGKEMDMSVQMLVNFQTQLAQVRMSINELREVKEKMKRQLSGEEPVIISEGMMDLNPVVLDLNQKLNELRIRLDVLLMEDPYSEEVYYLQQQIEETREKLQQEIEKTVSAETIIEDPLFYQRLRQRLQEREEGLSQLKEREKELLSEIRIYEKRLGTLPEQEQEYSRLLREIELNNEIYKMLKLKAEESRLTALELEQIGINYELLEEGRLPLRPSKPQKLLIAVVSLLLGVISGAGCVFIAEFADRSFKNTEDARSYLPLPLLGTVPKIMTEEEIHRRRRNQRNIVILFILLTVSLIVAGIVSSYLQEREVSEVLAQQETIIE
jgi:polysaccharide chain length determinant protein (PEP-CTERM system associated)